MAGLAAETCACVVVVAGVGTADAVVASSVGSHSVNWVAAAVVEVASRPGVQRRNDWLN